MNTRLHPDITHINVSKLIEGLNKKHLLNDVDELRVAFNDSMHTTPYGRRVLNIRVLSITTRNRRGVIKSIDFNDIFDITGHINVWLNVGTQLDNVKMPIVRQLREISIDVNPTVCKDYSFHKITYIPIPNDGEARDKVRRLERELSTKHLEHLETTYTPTTEVDPYYYTDEW
jgi:hypothetical protein